jgi:hypothetical protein
MVLHILFIALAISNLLLEDIFNKLNLSNTVMGISRVINTILLMQLFLMLYRLPNETNLA